jgi:hypothetical protein
LAGEVHLEIASPALESLSVDRHPVPARLLGLLLDEPRPADKVAAYAREGDLVATFEELPTRKLRVQAYWRTAWAAHAAGSQTGGLLAGIDLEVSVQTSLLDMDPRLTIESQLPPAELCRLVDGRWRPLPLAGDPLALEPGDGTSAILCRFAREASYFEITYPSDFRRVELARTATGLLIRRPLFGPDLEKGVILRSRIRGGFVPRDQDEALAGAACQAFLESPLPLTT